MNEKQEAAELMKSQWIHAFSVGEHTNSAGVKKKYDNAKIESIVAATVGTEFPAVIGHPKTDSPAWGWFNLVKSENGDIFVKPRTLIPEFALMVKNEMFPKRSIAFNQDGSIRHLGFLGAQPPALKDLKGIQFSEDTATEVIEFANNAYHIQSIGSVFQRLREWMIEKFGSEEADKAIPNYEVDFLKSAEDDEKQPEFSKQKKKEEQMIQFTKEQVDQQLAKQKADFSAEKQKDKDYIITLEAEAAKRKKDTTKQEVTAFCESLKKDGKLLPAWEGMGLITFMEGLAESEDEIEFAEGKKETQSEFFQRFLSELPKVVEFAEIAKRETAQAQTGKTHIEGPVDPERNELHLKALAYERENKGVTYIEAYKAIGGK